jgi:hypothetical protein
MAHPIYRWRLDELTEKRTLHTDPDTGAELKVQTDAYQVWLLADGVTVRVEARQDDGTWELAERYLAKPPPPKW